MSGIYIICNAASTPNVFLTSLDPPSWGSLNAHSLFTHGVMLFGDKQIATDVKDRLFRSLIGPLYVCELGVLKVLP